MKNINHIIQPDGLVAGNGWSHIVSGNGMPAFISGQVSVDQQGSVIGIGDMEAQIRQVYHNLELCLKYLNTDWQHVAKITYYATDITIALPLMRRIREEIMPPTMRASNTFVEVSALAHPDLLFEAEAFALIDL